MLQSHRKPPSCGPPPFAVFSSEVLWCLGGIPNLTRSPNRSPFRALPNLLFSSVLFFRDKSFTGQWGLLRLPPGSPPSLRIPTFLRTVRIPFPPLTFCWRPFPPPVVTVPPACLSFFSAFLKRMRRFVFNPPRTPAGVLFSPQFGVFPRELVLPPFSCLPPFWFFFLVLARRWQRNL